MILDEIRRMIREAGLRATPARIATFQRLRETGSPMTHAEVAESLESSGIDRATVFRNLHDMVERGLLRRTELGDHVWRFEVIDSQAHRDSSHPHFLCIDCGAVRCLDQVTLTAGSQRASERVGEVTEILLRGYCNDCRT